VDFLTKFAIITTGAFPRISVAYVTMPNFAAVSQTVAEIW